MVKAAEVVRAGLPASASLTVKLAVPTAVGVPLMTPLVLLSVRPAGSAPCVIDQVYGVMPPVAEKLVV